MTSDVLNFGCRLNVHEAEVMLGHAKEAGLQDTLIINSCAVTAEAERQARQAIRRAKRDNPDVKIIVTGCAAQSNPKQFSDMAEVHQVIGNDIKLKKETWAQKSDFERVIVNDIMSAKETAGHLVAGFSGKARAFVQVQNGCDHRCTFCIIPYGRGNSRSVPVGDIVRQCEELVANGYKEVVLTGVDITSYGKDLPGAPTLGEMIKRLLTLVPDLQRLRLSSLDPIEIDDTLWRLIGDDARIMPHLHISLQAGDDMILKRMKRRHLRDDAIGLVNRARSLRPDIVFGADLIAGFPTETDEMFDNTYRLIEDCNLTFLHVFPYSERTGTPAARIPNQVPVPLRKERAKRLRDLGALQVAHFLQSRVGKMENVLIEQDGVSGYTEHFAPWKLQTGKLMQTGIPSRVQQVVIDAHDGKTLQSGNIISHPFHKVSRHELVETPYIRSAKIV